MTIWSRDFVRPGSFIEKVVDEGFDFRWQQHPKPQATVESAFWPKTGWDETSLRGKTIFEAGCGGGRFIKLVEPHVAQVFAVDGSEAALRAAKQNAPSAILAQADLLDLPIKDEVFDLAYSLGVLHHTADPKKAFMNVARTVKRGGEFAVWVYDKPSLDDGRMLVYEWLHEVTRACPPDVLYAACKKYAPKIRDSYVADDGLRDRWTDFEKILRFSNSRDDEECVSDTFDWHTPQYRYWHTLEEVESWFKEAGYEVNWVGDFPVSMKGIRL